MPVRFISLTTSRPKSVRPLWCCDIFRVDVAAGVAQFVGVRPGQRHVAYAQPVVVAQNADVALDRVATLHTHQRGKFLLPMCAQNVLGAEGHHHLVGMASRLLVDGVNHVESALGLVAFVRLGLDPDGEELRPQIAGLDLIEVHVAFAGVLREVEVLVHETPRRVGVSVNDEGGVMNLRASRQSSCWNLSASRLLEAGAVI